MEHDDELTHSSVPERRSKSLLGLGLAVLFATATFFSGLHLGDTSANLEANIFSIFKRETRVDASVNLDEFWRVWNLLDEKFVNASSTKLTTEEKIQGAIDGLVNAYGDPYTIYLPKEDAEFFEEDISGNFGGVGMEVGMRERVITVIAPLPESPAERAGILAGDAVIKIDETSTEDMSIDEAVRLIRGEKGTEVRLTLYREGETEYREITIVRDAIMIPTSKTEVRDDVFVVTLYSFNALAESEMQQALRAFVRSGKEKLVLDLRGNPGGYLEGAVSIASYFLPVGKTVVRENFGGDLDEEVYRSLGREIRTFTPDNLVVLVDGGSASASEILAGALKEHNVATIIGAQTFGKGSVQELIKLDEGSSLKVTVARWLTPNGLSISEGGLTPDIVVERTPEDREASRDPQLDKALEFLRK